MKRKQTAFWMTVFLVIMMAAGSAVSAGAASANVTRTLSRDKNLKKICRVITAYTTAMDLSENPPRGTKTVKLNNANQLSIAAFVRFNETGKVGYTASVLRKETKALFGKAAVVNNKKIKKLGKTKMLVCCGIREYVKEPYMYCGGEFGDGIPLYKIKKITKKGKDTYKVIIENRLGYYGEKGTDKVGMTTLILQKKKSSSYGYIVKKISYKCQYIY